MAERAGLKAETEGLIIAAQDQSLFTRNCCANMIKTIAQTQYVDWANKKLNQLTTCCRIAQS